MLIKSVFISIPPFKGWKNFMHFCIWLIIYISLSALKSHDDADYNHFLVQIAHMMSDLDGPIGQVKPDKLLILTFGDGEAYDYIADRKNPLVDSVKGLHYPWNA